MPLSLFFINSEEKNGNKTNTSKNDNKPNCNTNQNKKNKQDRMDIRNRTSEFQQCVVTYKKLHNRHLQNNNNILTNNNNNNNGNKPISEFQRKASGIAKEISQTAQLLSKLAILAKRKPMFNDNPVEIAELSFLIKRKIYSIEQELVSLARISNNTRKNNGSSQVESNGKITAKHSHNVVNLLNTKMKNISGDFKNVLEERQKLEINNRDRWGKINENEKITENIDNTNKNESILKGNETVGYNSSNPFMSTLIDENEKIESNKNNGGLSVPTSDQQLMLMEEGLVNENVYLQERNNAVETIESTIQEVGNLFQQLASMVQEQGETIQRIDANVDDIDLNITGAQRELLKYFDRVKSNRWLAAKIFLVIFVFFLIWVLVN